MIKNYFLYFFTVTFFTYVTCLKHGFPVILVPGDGGSQLEVKLNKTKAPHVFCEVKNDNWTSLWLNLEELFPKVIDCFVDNMRLHYDRKKRRSYSREGIHIRFPGWGHTRSIEFVDPDSLSHWYWRIKYFHEIVNGLVAEGYERGVSVRGAPYDFRRAPNELGEFYKNLKALIEETYLMNNKTRVVLVCHSLGNPTMLYFLNNAPQAWKDQHIQSFVALAGVFAGTPKLLRLFASGDNLGISVVTSLKVRPEQRSMPSSAFLMPNDRYWNKSEILVYTDKKNYTVADYKEFFQDIDFMDGWYMRQDTENLIKDLIPPRVTVHCVHGVNLNTPAAFRFRPGGFPDVFPETINGNGDGTVDIRSLLSCLDWRTQQKQPVYHYTIDKAEHMHMLSHPKVVAYVVNVALGKSPGES